MYLTRIKPMLTIDGFRIAPNDDASVLYRVNAVEHIVGDNHYKVGVCGHCVAISADLDTLAHNIADCADSSLFRELTLAGCVDTAVFVGGVSVYPCRNDIAALYLARYFADLADCVASFVA